MAHHSTWLRWCLILIAVHSSNCATPFLNVFLDGASRSSLHNIFVNALKSKDLPVIHHGLVGLKTLGYPIADGQTDFCALAKSADLSQLGKLYHATGIISVLENCKFDSTETPKKTVNDLLTQQPNSQTIFLALDVARKLNLDVDEKKFTIALSNALKKDDSANSIAHGINAASLLDKENAEKFFTRIEDFVGLADDVDGKYLHLEGGLSITAFGIHGIYALADKLNKSPNVKSDEAVKLTSYLMSRRSVQSDRGAYLLVLALHKLANNNFQIPVVFSLASKTAVSDTNEPLHIRVSNVLGESVGSLSINMDAVTNTATKEIVLKRTAMKLVDGDKTSTLYEINIADIKQSGFYNLALTAGSQDKRLVGTNGALLKLKVLAKVRIEDITVALFDREISKPNFFQTVKESAKLGRTLEADSSNKLEVKFVVKEAVTNEVVTVHQAFLTFIHTETKQEIIFVATPEQSNVYIFDIDFEKSSKDFEGLSGKYNVHLTIGDASITYPFDWNLVDIILTLSPQAPRKIRNSEKISYEKLPEIEHKFREMEKRPSKIVADAFTILCIVPLLLLLILWLRIGINFSNMPISPFIILFHGGLIGIFALYFAFWLRFNMFETLKYLSVLGAITFVSGNRLLRVLASRRKEKTK